MHCIDLSQMTPRINRIDRYSMGLEGKEKDTVPKSPSSSHLNTSDRLKIGSDRSECRVIRRFPSILQSYSINPYSSLLPFPIPIQSIYLPWERYDEYTSVPQTHPISLPPSLHLLTLSLSPSLTIPNFLSLFIDKESLFTPPSSSFSFFSFSFLLSMTPLFHHSFSHSLSCTT